MNKFGIANVVLLIVSACAGAKLMWYYDDWSYKHQASEVFLQLRKDAQPTAVDVHKIGFHGNFVNLQHMPACGDVPSDDEKKELAVADPAAEKVFATPGGAYTQADIDLNGTTPPFVRFHDFVHTYDIAPKPGKMVDPILGTLASGGMTWYVGGKLYSFASIPSLEEFVRRAKTDPKTIPPAEAFTGSKVKAL